MHTRRDFLGTALGGAAAGLLTPLRRGAGSGESAAAMPMRAFGRTGVRVSQLGLGGWHLGIQKERSESHRLIRPALEEGLNFLDNSNDYHEGQSEICMGEALQGRRDQAFVMTKHNFRDRKSTLRDLEVSLQRLQTDVSSK